MLEGAAIGVAVVLAVIFISRGVGPSFKDLNSTGETPSAPAAEKTSGYSAEIPKEAKSTTPTESAPVGPAGDSQLNFFNLVASKQGFSPSSITVKKGDLAQFRFSAKDGDYDFFVPAIALYYSVKQGETKQILMQLTDAGTFSFECRDFCPDSGKISGQLIVLPE